MLNILDLGTGSGCIILTLLREFPNSKGIAVDSSQNALAIAKQNAYNLNVSYVEFVLSKWCEKIEKQHFNLIVSNPPYIPSHESKNLEKELGFEPEQALYAGEDGLNAYREIADNLNEFSFDYAIFEIGISQEAEVIKIFSEKNMKHIQTLTDLADIPRTLVFEKVKFI